MRVRGAAGFYVGDASSAKRESFRKVLESIHLGFGTVRRFSVRTARQRLAARDVRERQGNHELIKCVRLHEHTGMTQWPWLFTNEIIS